MVKILSNIKSKIEYERGKTKKIEKKIIKEGVRFDASLIQLDANIKVIKDVLFKEKKITEEEFELEYLKKVQIILKNILEEIKKVRKKQLGKLIVPKTNLPKDLKGFDA